LIKLWLALSSVVLHPDMPDNFSWPCAPSDVYTAKSTYKQLWQGTERVASLECIWKCKVPLKIIFLHGWP
jgi:hypothetical protein